MEPKSKWQLIVDLIKSIWTFLTGWKSNDVAQEKEKFKDAEKDLEKQYNTVDENKDNNKSKNVEDRLNNMF